MTLVNLLRHLQLCPCLLRACASLQEGSLHLLQELVQSLLAGVGQATDSAQPSAHAASLSLLLMLHLLMLAVVCLPLLMTVLSHLLLILFLVHTLQAGLTLRALVEGWLHCGSRLCGNQGTRTSGYA